MGAAYRHVAQQVAPARLLGRDAEMAELADFCVAETDDSYRWWRSDAWAGKSALLSSFVLNPPKRVRDRIKLVSFFVTARLAGQDTREAFTAAIMGQLGQLTRQGLPVTAGAAAREERLGEMLAEAAEACLRSGRRLILVVDGLDEDRAVTAGPGAPSIAGLLPARPPAGLRVIVAGRRDVPVPEDVPDGHPLRNPDVVRTLDPSPQADEARRLGRAELTWLLAGGGLERDVLGLVTAAGGGLSGSDLCELTGAGPTEIEKILHTAERTFTRRAADRTFDTEVYLLGHEQLARMAGRCLGASALAGYRERLHRWAQTYQAPDGGGRPWPRSTPAYLMTGYFGMLAATGDTDRIVTLAQDRRRHDRMLAARAGAAALGEVMTAQDLLLARPEPDLPALARLSIHRAELRERGAHMPIHGSAGRAAATAAARIGRGDSWESAWALAEVAVAAARVGRVDRATHIATSITDAGQRAWALAEVTGVTARAGEFDRAVQIAAGIAEPEQQAEALARVATAAARAGEVGRAGEATVAVRGGEVDRAVELAERAAGIAATVSNPWDRAWALAAVAAAMARAGRIDRAVELANCAARVNILDPGRRTRALAEVAVAAAAAGQIDRAAQIATSVSDPELRARALGEVARVAARSGQIDRAAQIATSVSDPEQQARTLTKVSTALAAEAVEVDRASELLDRAARIAATVAGPWERALTLAEVAAAAARAGQADRAVEWADRAAEIATARIAATRTAAPQATIDDPGRRARVLAGAAAAVARAGRVDRAMQIMSPITEPEHQARALAQVAVAAAGAGHLDQATHIATAITDPTLRAQTLADMAHGAPATAASHLLGTAFAVGPWYVPLAELAHRQPEAISELVDHICDSLGL